jgi:chromosome segregation ATPase
LSSLTEALTSAKKEIESQGIRLRDLETLLSEERRAREDAEERAKRLELDSSKEPEEEENVTENGDIHDPESTEQEQKELTGVENGSVSPSNTEDSTARLQQRLELMMSEMNEMKQQMEVYRNRAETAEADRKTLAEMIENIRQDHAKAASKEARRRSRSSSQSARTGVEASADAAEDATEAEEGEIPIIKDDDLDEDDPEVSLPTTNGQNGHTVEQNGSKQNGKPNSLATRRVGSDYTYYGGPVGAMVTVVALGVAVMAVLNQYPKAER